MPEADAEASIAADMALARAAVLEGGALAMAYRRTGAKVWDKAPGDPVTEADLAVNALLADRLCAARPDYGWLSEESENRPRAGAHHRIWVVDPIDGTRAFMREGDPYWCIGVGLVEDGRPIGGFIYAPELGALYEARLGGGAYLNGEPIRATDVADVCGARLIAAQGMIRHKGWREPWPEMVLADPKPNATLVRLALVASGMWDGVVVLAQKSDWDLAAGVVLVNEAGGSITNHRGEEMRFSGPVPAQSSIVAAGKRLHPLLVRRTQVVRLPNPGETA